MGPWWWVVVVFIFDSPSIVDAGVAEFLGGRFCLDSSWILVTDKALVSNLKVLKLVEKEPTPPGRTQFQHVRSTMARRRVARSNPRPRLFGYWKTSAGHSDERFVGTRPGAVFSNDSPVSIARTTLVLRSGKTVCGEKFSLAQSR